MYKCPICNKQFTKNFGYIRHLNTSIKNNTHPTEHQQLKLNYYRDQLSIIDKDLQLKSISSDNIFTIYSPKCNTTYTSDYLRPCTCPDCTHQRLSNAGKLANTPQLKQHKSTLAKQRWQDPTFRTTSITNMKKSFTDQKKQQYSTMMTTRWKDPVYYTTVTQLIKDSYTTQVRIKMSQKMTTRWQDPTYRQNTLSKITITNIHKYDNPYPFQAQQVRNKIQNTMLQRYGTKCYLNSEEGLKSQGHTISNINKEVAKQLNISEFEFRLESKSFDLKKDNYLIEVDPYYTHNVTYRPYIKGHLKSILPKSYHRTKTILAEKHNYRCIHIFDWDDINKIKEIITPHPTVYARKTTLQEIDTSTANKFLSQHHLQGPVRGQQICLGLYYNDVLIEVMTFGKPRYNQKYQYELLRLCTSNYNVIGGASKLFKYFIKNYQPQSIISYCDRSKFKGEVYQILGFTKLHDGSPSRHWYNPELQIHITDNLLSKHGFTRLVGKYFNNTKSNHESNEALMLEHGFVEIYDCGQAAYVWQQ